MFASVPALVDGTSAAAPIVEECGLSYDNGVAMGERNNTVSEVMFNVVSAS